MMLAAIREHRRALAPAGLLIVVIALALSDTTHALIARVLLHSRVLIESHPVWGAALFVVLAATSAMAVFVSSAVLIPVAVFAWGRPLTTLLLCIGWLSGGALSYVLGRYPGRRLLRWFARPAVVVRYEKIFSADASFPLVALFQLAVPSEVPGYVLGSVRYPFLRYFIVLLLAEIPWAAGAVYLGDGFLRRDYALLLILGTLGIGLSAGAMVLLRSRLRRVCPESRPPCALRPLNAVSDALRYEHMSQKLAIVYSSRHGHVERIARYVADIASARGVSAHVVNVHGLEHVRTGDYDAFLVTGSVHFGRHARTLERFVAKNLARLSEVPSVFISVSAAAASLQGRHEAEVYRDAFLARTHWRPDLSACVAGAIPYTKYDWFTRQLMKFASRIAGRDTDTTRDFEYTDWFAVDGFADDVMNLMDRYAHRATMTA